MACSESCRCERCMVQPVETPAGHKYEDQGNVVKVTPSHEHVDRMRSNVLRNWDPTMRDECGIG